MDAEFISEKWQINQCYVANIQMKCESLIDYTVHTLHYSVVHAHSKLKCEKDIMYLHGVM